MDDATRQSGDCLPQVPAWCALGQCVRVHDAFQDRWVMGTVVDQDRVHEEVCVSRAGVGAWTSWERWDDDAEVRPMEPPRSGEGAQQEPAGVLHAATERAGERSVGTGQGQQQGRPTMEPNLRARTDRTTARPEERPPEPHAALSGSSSAKAAAELDASCVRVTTHEARGGEHAALRDGAQRPQLQPPDEDR